jgi:acyl dehydratase
VEVRELFVNKYLGSKREKMEFWRKTVTSTFKVTSEMITEFAKLTGDDAPHHLHLDSALALGYEKILSQGLLIMSLTGRASSQYLEDINRGGVTYGYDRIRFIKPVYADSNLRVEYEPKSINEKNIIVSEVIVLNDLGETIFVANHLLKLL